MNERESLALLKTFNQFLGRSTPEEEAALHEGMKTGIGPDEMARLLAPLSKMERDVLFYRFGLDRDRPRSFAEVAEVTGLGPRTVRKVEQDAMRKIKERPDEA